MKQLINIFSAVVLYILTAMNTTATEQDGIRWHAWNQQTFAQAKKDNRMIFIDVGIEGCTACRRMTEITFTDPAVIDLMNRYFINITVDAETRPDIGERYSDWAWPAIIFLAPDSTQVLAFSGNRRPESFISILKGLIEKHEAGKLEVDELTPYAAPPEPEETDLIKIRNRVRAQLDRSLNEELGGWGRRMYSTGRGSQLKHLYLRAHMYNHPELREIALKTTHAFSKAIDPVWGGVFIKAFHNRDNAPERFRKSGYIPEKRISQNANALNAFAEAYQITGEKKFLNAMHEIDRYIREWMMDKDGTFFTSQEDEPPGLPKGMDVMDYWALDSDSERQRYGIPPIDHGVYTDKNGQVITAYVRAYEATGKRNYLNTAVRSATSLIDKRMQEEGWILQAAPTSKLTKDNRMRPLVIKDRPYLSAQAWFGRALLELYRATGEAKWINHARGIAAAMINLLQDQKTGGFYATALDEKTSVFAPRKPLEANATAAHFFYDLWVYTKDKKLAPVPARTIRAVALPEIIKREGKIVGELALALEKLTAAYVEFSVVGNSNDPRAQALFEAGRSVYEPRKLLHYEKPGRYPEREQPAMYICNPDKCSLPIEDPAKVAEQARIFHAPATSI